MLQNASEGSKHYTLNSWLQGVQSNCCLEVWGEALELLPEAEDRGQQIHRAPPHTEGQLIDCSPRTHGIR